MPSEIPNRRPGGLASTLLVVGLFFLAPPAHPQGFREFANSYAVVIGIHTYNSKQWSDLPYGRTDAEAMLTYLQSQGFEVTPLFDSQATKRNILETSIQLAQRLQPDDRVVFYFSGHGAIERKGDETWGYIVPYGAAYVSDYISNGDIQDLSRRMKTARHQLFIFDSCFSGQMITRTGGVSPDIPNYIDEVTKRIVREGFAAGGKDQSVLDSGPNGRSVFTAALLKGLAECKADLDGDGFITFAELDAYVTPLASNAFQTPARGVLPGDEGGLFVFRSPCGRTASASKPAPLPKIVLRQGERNQLTEAKKLLQVSQFAEAVPLLRDAADTGDVAAIVQLGDLYRMGWGISQDYAQARQLYEKAVAAGNTDAMSSLGWLYQNGWGGVQDYAQARRLYEKAAAAGDPTAMNNLGYMYENGLGVKEAWWTARDWYKKAVATDGDAIAMTNLGHTYEDERDYKKAMDWYEKAAAAGNAEAMASIGYLYDTGYGKSWGNPNYKKARDWYQKAAEAGSAGAMNNLGDLYASGHGVDQDYQEARTWYEKSAAAGNAAAMYSLGDMYEHGRGVAADRLKALQWYEKAAAAGNKDAAKRLNKL
jgi:hypothetical protein